MTIRVMAQSRKQGEQPPLHSGAGSLMRSIACSSVLDSFSYRIVELVGNRKVRMGIRFWGVLAGFSALAGCDDMPQARSKSEIENIARKEAADFTGPVLSRNMDQDTEIAELKRQIAHLEGDTQNLNKRLMESADLVNNLYSENKRHSDNERAFQLQIDYLRARQGLPPMPTK